MVTFSPKVRRMKIPAILIFVVLLTGCQNENMTIFDKSSAIVLTDSDGSEYAVTHHIGNTYRVVPLVKVISKPSK